MRTLAQHKSMQMCAVLALAAIMIFMAGPATAAYNQRNNQGQPLTEQREQELENETGQDIDRQTTDQSYTDQSRTGRAPAGSAVRNLQLERQVASQLRSQGYGQAGQIMILATGNKVILLGNVPDRDTKKGAAQIAKQAASGVDVDDRLHVVDQPRQISDAQLQSKVTDKLSRDAARAVQVQAQNGTVVLQGHLNNWSQAADAIDAAFAAGATQVNSQLTVGAATAQAGGAGGYYPSYGYAPGQQGYAGGQGYTSGQQGFGAGARGGQASAADLQLAHQVAQQLQQQLPPGQNVQMIMPQSIYVAVQNGTVTLHGFVRDRNQIQQAEQIARSIQGVQNVTSDLAIFTGRGGMGGQGMYGQGGWQSGTAGGQGQYGQGGMSGMGGQGAMSDRRLAQTIQQRLQSQFPDANINVRASQGTVTLQGSVADSNQKQQAEQLAYSLPGVQNVQNNLTVGGQGGTAGQGGYYPPQGYVPGQQSQSGMSSQSQFGQGTGTMGGQQATMTRSDLALARQVIQQLQQQLQSIRVQAMRPNTIYVIAKQGTVTLDGFIRNPSVTQQATQIAKAIPGVQNVQSMLKTMGGAGGFAPTYGYVPGQTPQSQQDQMGQQGFQGQPGAGMSNQGTNTSRSRSSQNTGSTQFSQSAYNYNQSGTSGRNTSGMAGRNTGTGGQAGMGTSGMGAQGMQPMTMSPEDTALAQQVAQKLQQQLPSQKAQVIRMDTIYVMAHDGTVSLYGMITDPGIKQHASQVAQSVSGVSSVKNMLGMTPETGTSPALGYIPGQEDQSQDQQFGTDQPDIEEYSIEEFEVIEPGADESDTGTN